MKQMTSLANLGLLGNFIGMLTDSRSFLSYPRHEYFRRIMCELIGGWVENGEYPKDMKNLEKIVKGISYNNAVRYFGFDLETKLKDLKRETVLRQFPFFVERESIFFWYFGTMYANIRRIFKK